MVLTFGACICQISSFIFISFIFFFLSKINYACLTSPYFVEFKFLILTYKTYAAFKNLHSPRLAM
nr:MAG TPA: hypothetical protein [Caudoviricetes sp.]